MRLREILNLYDTTNVRAGHISTENLSNELDSITVVLSNIPKIDIESRDIVEFTDDNNVRSYWLVGNVNKTFMTFTEPFLYEYTIDLISPTKLLEFPIPSQAITYRDANNRDLYEYVDRAFFRYFKLEGRYAGMSVSLTSVPIPTMRAYNNGHAPEATIEKPTLREYLDFLFNFVGYISQIEIRNIQPNADVANATLAYYIVLLKGFNLNPTGSEMNSDYIVEIHESKQGENYITCLEQNMDEVLIPNYVTEKLRFKSEQALVNEENAALFSSYKIYDVKNFTIELDYTDSTINNFSIEGQIGKSDSSTSSGQSGDCKIYLGKDPSNVSIILQNFYEIITINQAETSMCRSIYNPIENDSSHDSTYRRWIQYTKVNGSWVAGATVYVKQDQEISNYKYKLVRNYSSNMASYADYLIIPKLTLDLKPYLIIEDIYNSYEIKSYGEMHNVAPETLVKNNIICWSRGSRTISGSFECQKYQSGNITYVDQFAITYAIEFAAANYVLSFLQSNQLKTYTYSLNDAADNVVRTYTYSYGLPVVRDNVRVSTDPDSYSEVADWLFTFTYQAYSNLKIRTDKDEMRHRVISMDSNTNISTDVLSEVKRSKQKVKQLANPNLIMNAFSNGTEQKYHVGDYIYLDSEKYTLISLETMNDISSRVYKGILSKNYSNQVINTIINREKRYYSIPDPSSAVIRHEKIEYTISGVNNSTGYNIKCNYALVRTKAVHAYNNVYLMTYCILPITGIISEDNHRITYTLEFMSNAIYGYKPTTDTLIGGNKIAIGKYTDDYAETSDLQIMFIYRDKDVADDTTFDKTTLTTTIESLILNEFSSNLPIINLNLTDNHFLKDAREQLVVSLDLKFSDTLADSVETAFESDYGGTYDKFNITT